LLTRVPPSERLLVLEDTAELVIGAPDAVRLEARPALADGPPAVPLSDLVRASLRLRPDRIVVGEVRSGEAIDMLQAMNTGHDGSLTTLHANSARDALHRLENLVLMAGHALPDRAIREQIASALEILVHISRISDGSRKVLSVQELLGMEGPVVTMQEIFRYVATGMDEDGRVKGHFESTGIVPRCCDRIRVTGLDLPPDLFERGRRFAVEAKK
jgi:pilus assembly protein CpaF